MKFSDRLIMEASLGMLESHLDSYRSETLAAVSLIAAESVAIQNFRSVAANEKRFKVVPLRGRFAKKPVGILEKTGHWLNRSPWGDSSPMVSIW